MARSEDSDALIDAMADALRPGEFVSYRHSWDLVSRAGEVRHHLDTIVIAGEAARAVELYEIFLGGCYEKADEIDDSGGSFGDFFQELFCSWIEARQEAGCHADETVREILAWMDEDDYGFLFEMEGKVAEALNREGSLLLKKHFEGRFEKAFAPFEADEPKCVYDYPSEVRMAAGSLKGIYVARKDVRSYVALCEKTLPSPKDCESVARLYKAKGRHGEALSWVERGLAIENDRRWGNQASYSLEGLQRELLSKMGRGDDALQNAWAAFTQWPSAPSYEELMRYVPRRDRRAWHGKAMLAAEGAQLADFIALCVATRELDLLAERVDSEDPASLEQITHHVTEDAAAALERAHGLTSARVYCALAMRTLGAGKSKYYTFALEHLQKARELYHKHGQEGLWQAVVNRVREDHSRKHSFMPFFEEVVAGRYGQRAETFETRARKRWKKHTSE